MSNSEFMTVLGATLICVGGLYFSFGLKDVLEERKPKEIIYWTKDFQTYYVNHGNYVADYDKEEVNG